MRTAFVWPCLTVCTCAELELSSPSVPNTLTRILMVRTCIFSTLSTSLVSCARESIVRAHARTHIHTQTHTHTHTRSLSHTHVHTHSGHWNSRFSALLQATCAPGQAQHQYPYTGLFVHRVGACACIFCVCARVHVCMYVLHTYVYMYVCMHVCVCTYMLRTN